MPHSAACLQGIFAGNAKGVKGREACHICLAASTCMHGSKEGKRAPSSALGPTCSCHAAAQWAAPLRGRPAARVCRWVRHPPAGCRELDPESSFVRLRERVWHIPGDISAGLDSKAGTIVATGHYSGACKAEQHHHQRCTALAQDWKGTRAGPLTLGGVDLVQLLQQRDILGCGRGGGKRQRHVFGGQESPRTSASLPRPPHLTWCTG